MHKNYTEQQIQEALDRLVEKGLIQIVGYDNDGNPVYRHVNHISKGGQ